MRYDKLLDSFKKRKYGMMTALGMASVALCIGGFGLGYQFTGLARTEIEHRALRREVSTSIPALKDININEVVVSPLLKTSYPPLDGKQTSVNETTQDRTDVEILRSVHEAIKETEELSRTDKLQSGKDTDQTAAQDVANVQTVEDEKATRGQVFGNEEEETAGSNPAGSEETEQGMILPYVILRMRK